MCLVKHKIYAFVKKMCFAKAQNICVIIMTQNICVLQKYKIDLSGKNTRYVCSTHCVGKTQGPI